MIATPNERPVRTTQAIRVSEHDDALARKSAGSSTRMASAGRSVEVVEQAEGRDPVPAERLDDHGVAREPARQPRVVDGEPGDREAQPTADLPHLVRRPAVGP